MKVVVDGFGGDNAPLEIVEGAVLAVKKIKDLTVVITGDKAKIEEILAGRTERIEIVHASEVIAADEVPTVAIREKKDSSLVVGFDLLKNDKDVIGLVSAGNTGAMIAGAVMKIGRIKGIARPTVAPILPTRRASDVMICDSGANIECKSEHLASFALMGSAYYSIVSGNESPRIGLLNNGAEEHKGNELTKATYPVMKTLPINFIGNVEARAVMSGDVDVIVCDGFSGNVLLKGLEGTAHGILSTLKSEIKKSFMAKIGYLFMKKAFGKLKDKLDINKHGGSPILGCKKLIVKNHGSCGRDNILASIEHTIKLHEHKLNERIEELIEKMTKTGA